MYGYRRVEPLPTPEEVEQYYKEEFYASTYPGCNDSSLAVQEEEREFFNSRWDGIYQKCKAHFKDKPNISLFDIGCGYAQSLLYFREKGMNVAGLEPSPEGVAYAKEQGLDVYCGGIEQFSILEGRRFDVVTLLNVLEHLREPAQVLQQIRQELLNPGGVLILDVPNEFNDFQVVADAEYGLGQWWLCPPNHINYFDVDSLQSLVKSCGYHVMESEASFPLELFLLMGDVYVGNGELGRECHAKRMHFEYLMRKHGKEKKLQAFYKMLAELNLGRQVLLIAQNGGYITEKGIG